MKHCFRARVFMFQRTGKTTFMPQHIRSRRFLSIRLFCKKLLKHEININAKGSFNTKIAAGHAVELWRGLKFCQMCNWILNFLFFWTALDVSRAMSVCAVIGKYIACQTLLYVWKFNIGYSSFLVQFKVWIVSLFSWVQFIIFKGLCTASVFWTLF